MRNKSALIPVALIALVGIVFASGMYFPEDNTSLPREPNGPGTIGGVLRGYFSATGVATNTEKLGGITATGYLRNNNCTDPINKKWIGVDADGKGKCGAGTPIFAAIGKFGSVTNGVEVMKYGSSTWTPAYIAEDLFPGDVIRTNVGTAMIDFALDASLLRLDKGTTLELRLGNLDGNSVAEAILSDGRLWGRILTSTGVNLGGGGIVAGVRGTSVSIEKSGMSYMMSIVDSQKPTNAGTVVPSTASPDDRITGTRIISNSGTVLSTFTQVNAYSNGTMAYINPMVSTKETMIASSSWIRDNTKLDIDYLYANSGAETIIKNEYNITLPPSISTDVLTALCSREEGGTDMNIYWKSLIGTIYDKCRSSQLVAFAEYDKSLSLYFSGMVVTENPGSTNNIRGIGEYLAYTMNTIQLDNLQGKTIDIEFDSLPNGYNLVSEFNIGNVILDLGDNLRIAKINNQIKCRYGIQTTENATCTDINSSPFLVTMNTTSSKIQIKIGNFNSNNLPTRFVIGNNKKDNSLTQPINTRIKSIQIR